MDGVVTEGAGSHADERAAADYRTLFEASVEQALAAIADPDPRVRPLFAATIGGGSTGSGGPASAPVELAWQHGQRGVDEDTALNRLYASLFIDAAEGRVDAYALVTRTEMTHERTREAHDAIVVDMEHRRAEPVTIYVLVDTAHGDAPTVRRRIPTEGRRIVFVDDQVA